MKTRPALRRLAARLGILPRYRDTGGVVRVTSAETAAALAAALGCDASTEEAATRALRAFTALDAGLVAPTRVVGPRAARHVTLALPARLVGHALEWRVELVGEHGRKTTAAGRLQARSGKPMLTLPAAPQHGHHRLHATVMAKGGGFVESDQRLIVVPERSWFPHARIGRRGVFGLLVNLYAVESARNWGVGDLGDLATIVDVAGDVGAAFVGVNPLHALRNARGDISPYSPVSRLYRNPLYLDVEAVPELADTPAVARRLRAREFQATLGRLRAGGRVDYPAVMAAKGPVIAALHRTFAARHRDADTPRGRAYRRWCRAEGDALRDFATYVALEEHLASTAGRDWRRWPRALRDPASPEVARFRIDHAEAVDRTRWVQFELDRQLGAVAARATGAGLAVGVYQDVALGSAVRGADTWALQRGFVLDGTSLGAPPDDLAPAGQNWGLPPLDPHTLRRDGYAYWTRLLRSAFRHAGALRIDHVLGLFRQFWIPPKHAGSDGAYVGFPADDLLGILALESMRARALVIGEDLGTVPPGLPPRLRRAGVLSTRVLLFSRDRRGAFLPSSAYPRQALLGANTHDMVPLAGWTAGRDLALRRRHGQLRNDVELRAARRERRVAVAALRARLVAAGLWPADRSVDGSDPVFRAAVHAFLCGTESALVGIALDDLAGTIDPVNLPGVTLASYPSWSRRPGLTLEALRTDPRVAIALSGTKERVRRR